MSDEPRPQRITGTAALAWSCPLMLVENDTEPCPWRWWADHASPSMYGPRLERAWAAHLAEHVRKATHLALPFDL